MTSSDEEGVWFDLENAGSPRLKGFEKEMSLIHAAERGDVQVVQELLLHDSVDPNYAGEQKRGDWKTALSISAEMGHVHVVEALLSTERVDVGRHNHVAFRRACRSGALEAAKLLLKAGADPAACDNEALAMAANFGNHDVVKLLFEDPRVDPSARGTCFEFAARNGFARVVEVFLKHPRFNVGRLQTHTYHGKNFVPPAITGNSRNVEVLRVLLNDGRLSEILKELIRSACRESVPLLIEDQRVGYAVYKSEYDNHHGWAAKRYLALVEDRKLRAALWCMRVIGNGWADMMLPAGERMADGEMDWSVTTDWPIDAVGPK